MIFKPWWFSLNEQTNKLTSNRRVLTSKTDPRGRTCNRVLNEKNLTDSVTNIYILEFQILKRICLRCQKLYSFAPFQLSTLKYWRLRNDVLVCMIQLNKVSVFKIQMHQIATVLIVSLKPVYCRLSTYSNTVKRSGIWHKKNSMLEMGMIRLCFLRLLILGIFQFI